MNDKYKIVRFYQRRPGVRRTINNGLTLEQAQADLLKLLGVAQQGEEVVITSQGRPVARLTGVPPTTPSLNRQTWLAGLAQLRERLSTGKTGLTVEQILDEDRGN